LQVFKQVALPGSNTATFTYIYFNPRNVERVPHYNMQHVNDLEPQISQDKCTTLIKQLALCKPAHLPLSYQHGENITAWKGTLL
jgi:hypothetical protein